MTDKQKEKLIKKYDECDHIKVYTKIEVDAHEGRTCTYSGCLKCMLDDRAWDMEENELTEEEQLQRQYLLTPRFNLGGRHTKLVFPDLVSLHILYERIKKGHPLINDDTIADLISEQIQMNDNIKKLRKGR